MAPKRRNRCHTPSEADLVTITAGGSDLGFIGTVAYTALRRSNPDNPLVAMARVGSRTKSPRQPRHRSHAAPTGSPARSLRYANGRRPLAWCYTLTHWLEFSMTSVIA
jgi:hypothetical protein